jgi:hypothetical protein
MGSELVFVHPHSDGEKTRHFDHEQDGNSFSAHRSARHTSSPSSPQLYGLPGTSVHKSSHQNESGISKSYRDRQRQSPSDGARQDIERRTWTGSAPPEMLPKSSKRTKREVQILSQYEHIDWA